MSSSALETGLATLGLSRRLLMPLLNGVPEAMWFHVPVASGNHAAWIAGHIAWEDDCWLTSLVPDRGSLMPPAWHERFGQGSRPTTNPADYPAIADIRTALTARREELIALFTASVDRLFDPLASEHHGFARTLAALMPALACHETLHAGQLTVVRKSLELERVLG